MATITYYLRAKTPQRLSPVYVRYVDGRKCNLRTKTDFKVIPEVWGKGGKIIEKYCNDVFTINDARKLSNDIGDLRMTILKEANQPGVTITPSWLNEVIKTFHHPDELKPKPVIATETLNQFLKRYIDEVETGMRLTSGQKKFASSTVKALKGFKAQFDLYQKEVKKVINWQDIHHDFYNSYVAFFQLKNYRLNTIGRHIKHLKMIMNAAINDGLTSNIEHTRKSFRVVKTDVDFVYLTNEELRKLHDLEIENRGHALARDIFCVGCYTGQRFSDYSRLSEAHFSNAGNGRMVVKLAQVCIY